MTAGFFVKGILIGLLFGIPIGAVGALTVQRTCHYGFGAGLRTGIGSSFADCLYASCGVFGLTFISDFLLKYQAVISVAGGCLILAMGVRLVREKGGAEVQKPHIESNLGMFFSAFAVGVTNPAAILTFLFAFSYFGITGETTARQGSWLVAGVFIGTFLWWCILSASAVFLKRKTGNHGFRYMDRVFGTILILFGTVVFIRIFI